MIIENSKSKNLFVYVFETILVESFKFVPIGQFSKIVEILLFRWNVIL